jgi:hypothetical protein
LALTNNAMASPWDLKNHLKQLVHLETPQCHSKDALESHGDIVRI